MVIPFEEPGLGSFSTFFMWGHWPSPCPQISQIPVELSVELFQQTAVTFKGFKTGPEIGWNHMALLKLGQTSSDKFIIVHKEAAFSGHRPPVARVWNDRTWTCWRGARGPVEKSHVFSMLQRCCWIVFEDALGLGIPRSKGGLSIFFVGREDPNSHRLQYLLNQSIYIHLS